MRKTDTRVNLKLHFLKALPVELVNFAYILICNNFTVHQELGT